MSIEYARRVVPVLSMVLAVGMAVAAPVTAATAPNAAPKASTAQGYDQPPQAILDVLHAPAPPVPYIGPTRQAMLLVAWQEYPSMSRVAAPS
jgi:hypothetical protein